MHLVYMALLVIYNIIIYIRDVQDKKVTKLAEIILVGAVFYPAVYDFVQIIKMGPMDYMS